MKDSKKQVTYKILKKSLEYQKGWHKKALANECKGFFNNYSSGPCPDEGGILSHPARAGLCSTIRYLYKQQKSPRT